MAIYVKSSISLIIIIGILAFIFGIVGSCFNNEKLEDFGIFLLKVCVVLICIGLVMGFAIYALKVLWL